MEVGMWQIQALVPTPFRRYYLGNSCHDLEGKAHTRWSLANTVWKGRTIHKHFIKWHIRNGTQFLYLQPNLYGEKESEPFCLNPFSFLWQMNCMQLLHKGRGRKQSWHRKQWIFMGVQWCFHQKTVVLAEWAVYWSSWMGTYKENSERDCGSRVAGDFATERNAQAGPSGLKEEI